jgi:hypothetical protein
MVRTLLERAKPQLLEALEKQKVEYPTIAAEVEGYLKSNYFVVDLRIGTYMDLKSLWLQATGQHVESPWDCFEED